MNPASSKSANDQVPALHKRIALESAWSRETPSVFDFGAGVAGKVDKYCQEHFTSYFPYDPFNRDERTNANSLLNTHECDVVLCANVLNVVEDQHLVDVTSLLSEITCHTKDRRLYISVYWNNKLPVDRQVGDYFQRNRPLSWYIPHLKPWFASIKKGYNYLVCFP